MRLSFPGSFSLVRFFWRSKRNEHQIKKEGCLFETPPREEPGKREGDGKIDYLIVTKFISRPGWLIYSFYSTFTCIKNKNLFNK
jgi:hypothetical protein